MMITVSNKENKYSLEFEQNIKKHNVTINNFTNLDKKTAAIPNRNCY
ncbi:hypothetical protein CcarbDRAFT_4232 [Clostridium carboxidivorans P7]|uniref:Uncharacterized protein n=1 Tax=Clostridium carboxidivorans P7 TaxID=536227 RepID=C6PZL5_9CLOT|nr:hypothetical protein CcarbDRAFT_4232 [Clostridium carboxidivorans P7]